MLPVHLVRDVRRPGAANMAVDEALLERGEPIVRLYGWRPACVSLGYTQTEDDVDAEAARERGFDVVQRPTGGGAILHLPSEVTYCVVLPTDWSGLPGDLFEDYRYLSRGVLEALGDLGIEADHRQAQGGKDAFCYLREAGVSVVDGDGRKVSGGAQRRTKQAVLQHGTVLVEGAPEAQADVFGVPVEQVQAGVGALEDLGMDVDRDELVDRLAEALVATLGADDATRAPPASLDRFAEAEAREAT